MVVLCKVTARQLIYFSVIVVVKTIMACYIIAVALGHVPAWLPMISDCAVKPPEMYLFRIGIMLGASLITLQSLLVYYANRERPLSCFNAVLAIVSSISLGIVGAVNENENYSVHTFFAVLFFICYDVYMFTSVISAVTRKPSNCTGLGLTISATSFTVKLSLTIIGTMTGIGYTLELIGVLVVGGIFLPIAEWINTLIIMGFIWSYLLDHFLQDIVIDEVRITKSSVPEAKKLH